MGLCVAMVFLRALDIYACFYDRMETRKLFLISPWPEMRDSHIIIHLFQLDALPLWIDYIDQYGAVILL